MITLEQKDSAFIIRKGGHLLALMSFEPDGVKGSVHLRTDGSMLKITRSQSPRTRLDLMDEANTSRAALIEESLSSGAAYCRGRRYSVVVARDEPITWILSQNALELLRYTFATSAGTPPRVSLITAHPDTPPELHALLLAAAMPSASLPPAPPENDVIVVV